MFIANYIKLLGPVPEFLKKYLKAPTLMRLQKVGYFCGMDYASKDVYQFREYISRYDHSLTVALLTYHLTQDKKATIAALFHDIATPCFSHVIDYMNQDYATQESTERDTALIIKSDYYILKCLKADNLDYTDIIDYKQYSIVDNKRPKLCADRLDGVILTGYAWTKDLTMNDVENILHDLVIFQNSDGEREIGFATRPIAQKVWLASQKIDAFCHSKEDNYMMQLLADITALAIHKQIITYNDLYTLNEQELFSLLQKSSVSELHGLITKFQNITQKQITDRDLPYIKARDLNPLVQSRRLIPQK